jgi:glycosyltransferase involved in cell wall biosynthesis
MLTMVHANPARLENGVLAVDRKFHTGMLSYCQGIGTRIVTVHPASGPGERVMDPIEVPCAELPYGVVTLEVDRRREPLPAERARLRRQIAQTTLLYGGGYFGSAEIARSLGVPYVMVLELDLRTHVALQMAGVANPARRAVRALRAWIRHARARRRLRLAHSLHCNGYPVYVENERVNPRRLLYLDSRMESGMVISPEALAARLSGRQSGPLRLLFSGRYEPIKGAVDVVRVALECLRRGLDVEMHCYGQGSLRDEMRGLARDPAARGRIHVNDSLPYPELVARSKEFDLFVCCHVQGDPSCTYLEAFGAGLPIVGYGNAMWRLLCEASGVGSWSPLHRPERVADDVARLIADRDGLRRFSDRARQFAADHCFEREFARRIDALNDALAAARTAGRGERTSRAP